MGIRRRGGDSLRAELESWGESDGAPAGNPWRGREDEDALEVRLEESAEEASVEIRRLERAEDDDALELKGEELPQQRPRVFG